MPGVSALMPAWNAEVECCLSEDTRPTLTYHKRASACCDVSHLSSSCKRQYFFYGCSSSSRASPRKQRIPESGCTISVETKIDFHVDLHRHRDRVFASWFEPPLPNCFDRFLIQAHA
jgi:hypothetical protein